MSQSSTPVLSVRPIRALVDETFKVVVENLPPASPVTLHSLHFSEDKDYWEAYGHYMSDPSGTVNVSEDLSFGGTYTGKEPMGLLWSMRPQPGSRSGLRLRKKEVTSPMPVYISVYSGHISQGFRKQPPLVSVLTERWYMAPGVQRFEIKEGGVRGTLFIPAGPGPFPGLLDLWEGGGRVSECRSALLASHGYVSLALDYYPTFTLKTADLQLQYFETAFDIIKDHPRVIPDNVGIFGNSLGTVLALHMAAESTKTKPRCCVGVNGHHLHPAGTTLHQVLQFEKERQSMLRFDENNCQISRFMRLPIPSDPSQKMEVQKIKCPVLLVNGGDDQDLPTVEAAEDMARMMQAGGNVHLLSTLTYHNAGHLIEPPFSPHFRATNFIGPDTNQKETVLWGGQTKPHSDAQEDSWRRILVFLRHHLYSDTVPKARM